MGMAWLMVLPGAAAAPVDVTVQPDVAPWLAYLAPTVQGGSIGIVDGSIHIEALTVEATAVGGQVRIQVPWTFQQEQSGLPYGYYRQMYAEVYVEEDGVQLGYDWVERQYYTSYWDESGVFDVLVEVNGVELRHELKVYLYGNFYNSYPYRYVNQDGVSAVVATGTPMLVTERITTAPVLQGPVLQALDVRLPDFMPNVTVDVDFSVTDTAVTPDRFAILRVPYSFERDTTRTGWGWEYGGAYFYAYDQDGNYLGSTSMNWYRDHPCCSDSLDLDLSGELSMVVEFTWGSDVRREIHVYAYQYWYGYACTPQTGCPWFSGSRDGYGLGGLVYTLPANPPPMTPEGLAQEVLDLV